MTAWLHAQEKASMDPGSARTEVDGDGARAAWGSFPELFLGFSVLSQNSCSAASGFLFPPLLPSDLTILGIREVTENDDFGVVVLGELGEGAEAGGGGGGGGNGGGEASLLDGGWLSPPTELIPFPVEKLCCTMSSRVPRIDLVDDFPSSAEDAIELLLLAESGRLSWAGGDPLCAARVSCICSIEGGGVVLRFDSKAASDAAKALCILSISSKVLTGNDFGLRPDPLAFGGMTGATGGSSSVPAALSKILSCAAKWLVCTMCSPKSFSVPNPMLHTLQVRTALTLSFFGIEGGGGGGGGGRFGDEDSDPFHEVICSLDITFV